LGYLLQINQTARPLAFLMTLSAGGPATGKSPTVLLSKNAGASFASPAGAVSELGNGLYAVAPNATDANTLGPLLLVANASGCNQTTDEFQVVSYNPATFAGSSVGVGSYASGQDPATLVLDGQASSHTIAGSIAALFELVTSIAQSTVGVLDTATVPYLPVTEFLKRADLRTVARLCSDTGTPVGAIANTNPLQINTTILAADPNLNAALCDASGIAEQALLTKAFYSSAQLASLSGMQLCFFYVFLTRLTECLLYSRRPSPDVKQPAFWDWCQSYLDRMQSGERIFTFVATENAGLLSTQHMKNTRIVRESMPRFFGRKGRRHWADFGDSFDHD
jgi:hypothetical protein